MSVGAGGHDWHTGHREEVPIPRSSSKPAAVDATLEAARESLRAGDIERARTLFHTILERDPAHAESLHSLGRIALHAGRDEQAIPLIERSLERHPTPVHAHADLAVAYQNTGRDAEAVAATRRALALDPRHLSALNTLGNALRALGRPAEAAEPLRHAVELRPDLAMLQLNLAGALRDAGELEAAREACLRAVALGPADAEAHRLLGLVLRALGRRDEAIRSLERAIELDSHDAEAHHALANAHAERGDRAAAEAGYRRALECRPAYPEALHNLGDVLREDGRLEAAADAYRHAIELKPEFVEPLVRLAQASARLGRHEEALGLFERARALRPEDPEMECGAGNALRALGRFDDAAAAFERAARAHDDFADAWCNLSTVCLDRGMTGPAIEHAHRAIAARPDLPEAHWNLAQALLTQGDFVQGWRRYDARLRVRDAHELAYPQPLWDGAPLGGRTLFVTAEQGVGDEIMFASCVPDAVRAAGACVVECDARLVPLFARSFPAATCIARLRAADRYPAEAPEPDRRIAIGSLPRHFRNGEHEFPARESFLVPDAARVAAWRERLARLGPGLRVGISWRGGREALTRGARSVALADWAGIAAVPGVRLVNLQYGETAAERKAARREHGFEIHHWDDADPLVDLDGLAAQIAALDLVISVDNATVHMAGAVGTPTWVMLPAVADWRWMTGRDESPWYPAVRLFRQDVAREWAPVWERVTEALSRRDVKPARGTPDGGAPDANATARRTVAPARRTAWVGLLNDTSHWYHWGCTGTSTAIVETLEERGYCINRVPISGLYQCTDGPASIDEFDDLERYRRFRAANAWVFRELDEVDHVVINGEGSLHGVNAYVTNLLYLGYVARTRLGKNVQIVNHSCYPDGPNEDSGSARWQLYQRVYRVADFVAIREPVSFGLLSRAGVAVTRSFDCLPLFISRHFRQAVERRPDELVLAGSVALREDDIGPWSAFAERMTEQGTRVRLLVGADMLPARDDLAFARRMAERAPRTIEVVNAKSARQWLETLARAAVVVSGRFHHTIAAATLGTPYVLLDSNTPKNSGLAAVLESAPPLALDSPALAERLVERASAAIEGRGDYARGPRSGLPARLCADAMNNFLRLPAPG